jgi:aryl-alcohol dehydrogenase-like predicted oxidoreductase
MDYRYLGRSALKVSPLCIGTMNFGAVTDETVAHRIMDKAHEAGINFVDTADLYANGRSEEIVGRGVKAKRDDWVVATKFGNSFVKGPNLGGQSRKWILRNVEGSLKRLGTDYIDILYFHRSALEEPLEEALRAIGDLISQGKLRYYGVSNFRGWRIAEISHLADKLGMDRPIASQPLYNIVNRAVETEELPAAGYFGLGTVTYSPLARGVLTAKYQPGVDPSAETRAGRADKRFVEAEWRPESVAISQKIAAHVEGRGISAADFSLAWVLNNRLVTSSVAGPRTAEHWDGYMRALDVTLTAEDEAFIDSLVVPGHASTHGFTDPSYPVEGRVARGDLQSLPRLARSLRAV